MTTGEIPYAPASYREHDSDDPSDRIIGYPVYRTEPCVLPVPSEQVLREHVQAGQQTLRAYIASHDRFTSLEMLACTGLSRTLIYNHLQGCLDAGSIVAVGTWQAEYRKVTIYAKAGI